MAGGGSLHRGRGGALLLLAVCCALPACKEDLVFNLTQKEALEIVVVLKETDPPIDAVALPEPSDKEPMFKIQVDADDLYRAKGILHHNQLPKSKQKGLAAIFESPSMIPTPTEEKARYTIGVQGDLATSLEAVDNVVDAEVHIVLPETNPLESDQDRTPAQASVIVKYRPVEIDPTDEDQIKLLEGARDRLNELEEELRDLRPLWYIGDVETREDDGVFARLSKSDGDQYAILKACVNSIPRETRAKSDAQAALRKLEQNLGKRDSSYQQLRDAANLNVSTAEYFTKEKQIELKDDDAIEKLARPITSAEVKKIVSRAIPRLSPNNVAVHFSPMRKVKPPDIKAASDVPKPTLLILIGVAIVLALAVVGLGVWIVNLQKKVKEARANGNGGGPDTKAVPS